MPLYEYKCDTCGKVFEVMQRFSDAPLTTHEGCGGGVQRLISAPALQFKGSGWYITDYARSGTAKSGSESSGKSESKPETKSETKSDSSSSSSSTAGTDKKK
jgi:putative FmdB family regulatory protein